MVWSHRSKQYFDNSIAFFSWNTAQNCHSKKENKNKNDSSEKTSGVLAQELLNIFPEAVRISDNREYFVHYAGIIPLLIEGMKEQQEEIKALKQEVNYLKQLEQRVKALEQSNEN